MKINYRKKIAQKVEENTNNIGSISVDVEPYNSYVKEAIDLVNQKDSNILRDITDIRIDLKNDKAFGEYRSDSPHSILVNLPKIEQTVRNKMSGQPEEAIKKEIVIQIAMVLAHESGHQKVYTETKNQSESPAEQAEEDFSRKLNNEWL